MAGLDPAIQQRELSFESMSALSQALPIFYSTHDGQSRRIAERIAARLTASGAAAQAADAASDLPLPEAMACLPAFVLVASIRYGVHMRDARHAMDVYGALKDKPPLVLASVNLTARKAHKATPETNPYLRKWIRRRKLAPALAAAFAGRLDYPRYGVFDRLAMQAIMTISGGVTDPTAQIEYTDWNAVDAFADGILRLARASAVPS